MASSMAPSAAVLGMGLDRRVEDVFGEFCEYLGQHRVWARNDKANEMPA